MPVAAINGAGTVGGRMHTSTIGGLQLPKYTAIQFTFYAHGHFFSLSVGGRFLAVSVVGQAGGPRVHTVQSLDLGRGSWRVLCGFKVVKTSKCLRNLFPKNQSLPG